MADDGPMMSTQVSAQELMRVYGALMWSLAKVLRSPEVNSTSMCQSMRSAGAIGSSRHPQPSCCFPSCREQHMDRTLGHMLPAITRVTNSTCLLMLSECPPFRLSPTGLQSIHRFVSRRDAF